MGVFRRGTPRALPRDIVSMMERFGRHEIDVMGSAEDGYDVFRATQEPLLPLVSRDAAGFVEALADACVPVGGWAVYGAERTVVNLVTPLPESAAWYRILDASLEFLRANYVPPMRLPQYAWTRFVDCGGSANTWLELRPPPPRESAQITPLRDGELRPVLKLGPEPGANVIVVRRADPGYEALIDAQWSDTDPTRSLSEWKRADDLYDLYADVGLASQVWDWADPEIEPFIPAPKALI